ncbi:membrane protein G74 [Colobine gammaherpesvirus 1]|uniref:Membrane protein G74 n=1 Tax=Colobine gammaherpesvirus 1 TaxID=2597325 RepID=A0A5B8FKE6_9GAMA|nr:membrane protein G74 [Colobine gammaherpesvirus 1]QDQ69286.1 membrane protein G74 [Colobine gammaherpesvirus 1]
MANVEIFMGDKFWNVSLEGYFDNGYYYDYANYSANLNWADTVCRNPRFLSQSWTACILSLIFMLNVVGNGIVTYIFWQYRVMAKAVDVLLMSICLNSLCLSVSLAATLAMHFIPSLISGFLCRMEMFFYYLYIYLDIFSVVCISMLRYFLVAHSTREWPKNPLFGCLLASVSLIVAIVLSGHACRYRDRVKEPLSGENICYENVGNYTLDWKLHIRTVSVIAGFLLPLSLLILFYSLTWCVVRKTNLLAKRQVKGVIFVVVILFFVCCLPYHILNLLDTMLRMQWLTDSCHMRGVINLGLSFTSLLQALYSSLVPVVYSSLGSLFRKRVSDVYSSLRRILMSSTS